MSTNVLVEAKKELTKHIINRLSPFYYEEFRKMHNNCMRECATSNNSNILEIFSKKLKDVPDWNQNLIDDLFERCQKVCHREILSNLIKSVWIANVQILSAVRMNKENKETQVNVPDPRRFVHKCYVEAARDIHKNPYLFNPNVNNVELHKNQRDLLKLIGKAIKEAIRKMLPVEDILRQYLLTNNNVRKEKTPEISDQELKNILNEIDEDTKIIKTPKSNKEPSYSDSEDSNDKDKESNREKSNKKDNDDDSAFVPVTGKEDFDSESSSDESEKHESKRHRKDSEEIEVPIEDKDKSSKKNSLFFDDVGDSRFC
jgi:hypothetical protein